ncbi:helix-turn-helix transcriptional regulator [Microbacterium invictum]|uniref:Helix-turn-helix transcriptional regulator n=1 Tax=Microbacterium invictum TaxID=515415 RepID=A0ABZ0VBX8_9MICO|nr:helix-turn-helix transcriptional regulator [Microbacterium invictum]WQB70734.1 helix-turn-helix transcriptional regulator [Microbacterium invictum]
MAEDDSLGAYLRACRQRVGPADVGLPVHAKRRTEGLRREEVAVLAGVSVDYYTRLEQGRDQHPSPSIVRALAVALRLTPAERSHLFLLAGLTEPQSYTSETRESVRSLLDTLMPDPAYVVTPPGDFVAWNDATSILWIDPATLPPEHRNLAWMTLMDPRMRELWIDWESIARETVAYLRAAAVRYPDDRRLMSLLAELRAESTEFVDWWNQNDVVVRRSPRKRFAHPTHGEISFTNESMELVGEGLLFMVYVPADAASAMVCRTLCDKPHDTRRLRAVESTG